METLKQLATSLRPPQWVKNLFVLAALIFSQELANLEAFKKTFFAFVIFILASGAVYLFNDLCDLKNDQNHPQKKNRPLACGKLKIVYAKIAAVLLATISLTAAYLLSINFLAIIFIYLLLNILYSLLLKKIPILDLLIVTSGFVLRAVAGAEVISVSISPWLLVCTFFLALYITISKRLTEIFRKPDGIYHKDFLTIAFTASLIAAFSSYALYTVNEKVVAQFESFNLFLTIPLVAFGLLRYYYLILTKKKEGDPSKLILTDGPILISIFSWAITVIWIIYKMKLPALFYPT